MNELLVTTEKGLFCPPGNFYIDPQRGVDLAVITHAHGDHARWGSKQYIAQESSFDILKYRLGNNASITTYPYNEKFKIGQVWVSLHPAGHILGSSQIRLEYGSKVAVAAGDYKRAYDASCVPFEVVECDLFITESTFALPIYHWEDPLKVGESIYKWWQTNAERKKTSLLLCYSLGKTQRVLNLLTNFTEKDVYIHGSVAPINQAYEKQGIKLPKTHVVTQMEKGFDFSQELVIAPVSAFRSLWTRRFKRTSTAFASGWMAVRGTRRRKGMDKGFILSDHADWDDLLRTVKETKAKNIWVTHGNVDVLSRYLQEEEGIDATPLGGFIQEDEED